MCVCEQRTLECVHADKKTVNAKHHFSSLFILMKFGSFANPNIYQPPKNLKPPEYISSCIEMVLWQTKQRYVKKLQVYWWWCTQNINATHNSAWFVPFFFSFFLNVKLETLFFAFIFWCICLPVCMHYQHGLYWILYFIITCYVSIHVVLCEFWDIA